MYWRSLVAKYPERRSLFEELAAAYANSMTGNADKAIANLKDLVEKDLDDWDMAFWLGEAYSKTGKFDEAIAIWKDLIGKQPHQCQFHDTLA